MHVMLYRQLQHTVQQTLAPSSLCLSLFCAVVSQVGIFGIVHPDVLAAFGVEHPVSALELNIEPFCFDTDLKQLHPMHGWDLLH